MAEPRNLGLDQAKRFAVGLDHPECVTVDAAGAVFAGGEAGQIYRIQDDGRVEQLATTGGFVLGICADGDDALYVCDLTRREVLRFDGTGLSVVVGTDAGLTSPNHLVFDAAGRLVIADSGHYHEDDGRILLLHPDGEVVTLDADLRQFPNGVALHPTEPWLYVALSTMPGVARIRFEDGAAIGPVEVVVRLPGTVPDGLAFDERGGLYVSCYTPDRIYLVEASGETSVFIDDWESDLISSPTNMVFAGEDRKRLLIANLGRWHITEVPVAIAGARLHYPMRGLGGAGPRERGPR